jgi:hypothetical protein
MNGGWPDHHYRTSDIMGAPFIGGWPTRNFLSVTPRKCMGVPPVRKADGWERGRWDHHHPRHTSSGHGFLSLS